MDARNTGALIAQRRKALGLTQKQLAERLLVSDKAVSKWEVGASYPEVTLLPPLAQVLGLTVDELLAGEAQQPEQAADEAAADAAPQDAPLEDGGGPRGKAAAFSPEAYLPPREYLTDRLGGTDDKLLLAAVVLILAAAYCGRLLGQGAVLRDLVIVVIAYVAFRVWHGKQRGRFAALGVDTTVSRRRARMADILFSIVWLVVALAVWPGQQVKWLLSAYEIARIGRYKVVLDAVNVHITNETAWLGVYVLAYVPLGLALVGLFALAYRRMTTETRFRPLAVALPVLPALAGAAVIAWQRVQTALAHMPDYGEALSMVNERAALKETLETAGQGARTGAAIVLAVLVAVLLVLWRAGRRVPLVSAVLLAVYAVIWLPSGALWLDIGYEEFMQVGGTEDITFQLFGLLLLLLLTALSAGIALFADSLRRKKA